MAELLEDQLPPMGDFGEAPGYSHMLAEYFREHQSKYGAFAEEMAGVFFEDDQADNSSRYFNQYPPPMEAWETDYTTDAIAIGSSIGPSNPLASAGPQLPPLPPPSTSMTNPPSQKLYNCTYCGTFFDRYSRARDCRNMDLGLTPHHCLGKCGTVGW